MTQSRPRGRTILAGWGGVPRSAAQVVDVTAGEVPAVVTAAPGRGLLARGLGRSYGDAASNAGGTVARLATPPPVTIDTSGLASVGAGVSIGELIDAAVPQGWFVPVTPGTRHVTVGGAIAADIHGKNHHGAGTFGAHVEHVDLVTADGRRSRVGPDTDPELFWATVGGMGLTGVVVAAAVRLTPIASSTVLVDTDRTPDIDACLDLLAGDDAEYSVAWVDLLARGSRLGRSVVTRGTFADSGELTASPTRSVPAPPLPSGAVNAATVSAFNEVWYRRAPRYERSAPTSISSLFHPLDGLAGWNRMYGRRGFVQYQFVVPHAAVETLRSIVTQIADRRLPAMLTVLKRFGPANAAPLSFPVAGWTLAVDLPATPEVMEALDRFDGEVAAAGGRVYLAKDARLPAEAFRAMYPRWPEFAAARSRVDPQARFRSDLGRRLGLCP